MEKTARQKRLQLEEELRGLEQELAKILESTEDADIARKCELHLTISSLYTQIEGLKTFERLSKGLPSTEEILGHVDRITTEVLEKGSRFLSSLGSKLSEVSRGSSGEEADHSKVSRDFQRIVDLLKEGKKQFAYADLMSVMGEELPLDDKDFERMRHGIDAADSLIKAEREDVALMTLQKLFG